MNIQAVWNDWQSQLEEAEAELEQAEADYYSCRLNTPGRCDREWGAAEAARENVRVLRLRLKAIAADVERA